jgi:hypothetical protein
MGLFKEPEKTRAELRADARAKRIQPGVEGDAGAAEIFARLGPAGWIAADGGPFIAFPLKKVSTSYEQDATDHKFYGVDGADIEPLGLGVVSFNCEIPFLNHIAPGKAELWTQPLYPGPFRDLIAATQSKSKGFFYHPEFGPILCRPKTVNFSHDGAMRGGVIVSAVFRQTLPDSGEVELLAAGVSPITGAINAAGDLDASDDDLRGLVPELPEHERSFKDFMNDVGAFGDAIGSFGDTLTSPFKRMAAQANRAADSYKRLGKKLSGTPKREVKGDPRSTSREALTANGREALRRFQVNIVDAQRAATVRNSRTIRTFIVGARPVAAATVARALNSTVADILELNPALSASPEIPGKTLVRYRARAA